MKVLVMVSARALGHFEFNPFLEDELRPPRL